MKPFSFILKSKSYKTPRVSRLYLKLRSKLTLFFFLLVLIPFAVFIAGAYFYSLSSLENNTYQMSLINLSQEKNSISSYLTDLTLSIGSFSKDPNLSTVNWDIGDADITAKYLTASQVEKLVACYAIGGNKMITVYNKNHEKAAINSPSSQQWYEKALADPSSFQILGTTQRFYSQGKSIMVFSIAKAIENSLSETTPAVLLLDFDFDILSRTAEPVDTYEKSEERLIVNEDGNIIFSKEQGILTVSPDDGILPEKGSEKGFKKLTYRNQNVYMTYARFPELPWTFISMIPAKTVTGGILPSANPLILVFILIIPLILLLFLVMSSKLLNPINELTSVISDYEKGNFSDDTVKPAPSKRNIIQSAFSNVSEIDYLINKVYNIKLKQKEAELNSLQNQINPHFLYNTLESIRGAALYHGIHDIAAMSKALSLLFRYSISDRVLVSIKEEIQHLDNYMSIQNFRYENKFDLVYSISPELYNYKILKLTLQPLIENSIKHGLEMKLGKGLIKVEILSMDNNLKIQISDDGLGILPKKIEELNRALSRDENPVANEGDRAGTGIGVRNVNSRIKLYFGEEYGLKFREAPVGTIVEIILPAVKEN